MNETVSLDRTTHLSPACSCGVPVRLVCLVALLVCATTARAEGDALVEQIDTSLKQAADFLVSNQADDGAWYSEMYGSLREDPSLTPHVLSALWFLPQGGRKAQIADYKGRQLLLKLAPKGDDPNKQLSDIGLPHYFATSSVWIVEARMGDAKRWQHLGTSGAYLGYVDARQFDSDNGWSEDDPQFGGWGYVFFVPKKPDDDGPAGAYTSNISATLYALGALHHGGYRPNSDKHGGERFSDALVFVRRVQNYEPNKAERDDRFDDGGFFFNNVDDATNKAGAAGADKHGRVRFHSYGSTTADGLRALLRCGLPPGHPRVKAARQWLIKHFDVDRHPGKFNKDREILRQAYFYYYCWSVSHAFMHLGLKEIETPDGKVHWARAMAASLIEKQNDDGSWTLEATDMKGDDPLVSTPHAASALAICRAVLTGEVLTLKSARQFNPDYSPLN